MEQIETIALLYLKKLEKLSKEERRVLLKAVEWECTPVFTCKDIELGRKII